MKTIIFSCYKYLILVSVFGHGEFWENVILDNLFNEKWTECKK